MFKKFCLFLFLFLALISFFCFFKIREAYKEMPVLYVDGNYQKRLQWGSEKHPYNKISKAFEAALKKTSLPDIHLKNGEYTGNFEIPENMKIYGENQNETILKNIAWPYKIIMKNNSLISNLTILGGTHGIFAESKAEIKNCLIKEFKKSGIDALPAESEIIILNSEICQSPGKGIYIQRGRKMFIYNNSLHDNGEEGLDSRQVVSGEVTGNKIYNNGESGIESVVTGAYFTISKNEIWGNKSNGITFQYYDDEKKDAEIIVEKNKISAGDSEHLAISVSNPSGEKNKPENFWRKSLKIYDNNILEGGIKTRSLEIHPVE